MDNVGRGSIRIATATRAVSTVHEDAGRRDDPGARVRAVVKCTLTAKPSSLTYRLARELGKSPTHSGLAIRAALPTRLHPSVAIATACRPIARSMTGSISGARRIAKRCFGTGAIPDSSHVRSIVQRNADVRCVQSGFGEEKHSEWAPSTFLPLTPNPANLPQFGGLAGFTGTPSSDPSVVSRVIGCSSMIFLAIGAGPAAPTRVAPWRGYPLGLDPSRCAIAARLLSGSFP